VDIGYCPRCNVPIRGKGCDICHGKIRRLKFHDMGDIRPASQHELKIILNLIHLKEVRNYLRKRLILLAKQPGLDYRKDVFVDGYKIGIVEYIKDDRWRWRFVPTGVGAALFYSLSGHIDFDMEYRGHLKGKRISRDIEEEWAIFTTGNCVGVATKTKKGTKVKDIYCRKVGTRKRSNMETAVKANTGFLRNIEKGAIRRIKREKPDYVAFSGGKDSEVALYLAAQAGVKRAVYANTGLEFPETERFVYNFAEYLDIELIEIRPNVSFWDLVKDKGIPTKDNRWCTGALKLDSLKKLSGTIVDGTRRYESFGRMLKNGSSRLGNLRVIYPIIDWLALDVWLFIHHKGLPYNPIYDMGYERIGCFMCPSMLNSEFHNLKRTHPELFKRWYNFLREQGFTHGEIMDGTWRWKNLPAKMIGL
jgi:phosphoadenosine phosphosulfate reductase